MANKKPTLRYFARFKEDFGHLRAVVRYGNTRKYILSPIVVSRDQMQRLDTSGHIHPITNNKDFMTEGNLRKFTRYVWQTVKPLIESGEFSTTPSEKLTSAIFSTKETEEAKSYEWLTKQAEASFQHRAAESETKGYELHRLSEKDFFKLTEELKATLTPEEYAALWEKGGNDEK